MDFKMSYKFFTANPQFKDFVPVSHEDHKKLCLAILDDVKRKAIEKFFAKYDTERHASSALRPQDQPIYKRMVAIIESLKDQVNKTTSTVSLHKLVDLMIDETILPEDAPFTFKKILSGKLQRYYPAHDDKAMEIKPST